MSNRPAKQHDTLGEYSISKPSLIRRFVMDSYDAIPVGHNMLALIEFDVTEARKFLRTERKSGKKVSFFAYIIKSIATALSEHGEFNSMRNKNRIIEFKDVDVTIPIELDVAGEKVPLHYTIRDAAHKTVEEICVEIDGAKKNYEQLGYTGQEDKRAMNLMRIMFILPKFIRALILKRLITNPLSAKKHSGTTFVTSVGMFGSIPGFAIPYAFGPFTVSFALGSVVKKPAIVSQEILIREFLSTTIIFNHDVVDGAPAARLINRLKKLIENVDLR